MSPDEKTKKCQEYCPFLKANGSFCELFKCSLQSIHGITLKCDNCLNPEQRIDSYKALQLTLEERSQLWQSAIIKHNEIELGKKREQEEIRKKFAAFLEDKFGLRPPLEGNVFLRNLIINLYMVMDATERSMMLSVLNGRNADALIQSIERAPKDESLLRNIRRELDEAFLEHQKNMQKAQTLRTNTNAK